jgi:hypothetical protein
VKAGPAPEGPGVGSIQNPGVTDAGGEMLSDASVDQGSNDDDASGTSGSAQSVGGNVEMGFHGEGESAPDDGWVPSMKSRAPYSDVTNDASSNIDTGGN